VSTHNVVRPWQVWVGILGEYKLQLYFSPLHPGVLQASIIVKLVNFAKDNLLCCGILHLLEAGFEGGVHSWITFGTRVCKEILAAVSWEIWQGNPEVLFDSKQDCFSWQKFVE